MIPKQFHYNLKVECLPKDLLTILGKEMEKAGGYMAARGDASLGDAEDVSAVLSGTVDQFRTLIVMLNAAEGQASALAEDLNEAVSSLERRSFSIKGRGRSWELGRRTLIMGILNVTPDSFYDGGRYLDKGAAIEQAERMSEEGADWIDVGGESTRPGAEPVALEDELERVVPVVEALAARGMTVSVDTTKSEVARAALLAGAEVINDISALSADPAMAGVCAEFEAPVILMHMRGTPRTMQNDVVYGDLPGEVFSFFLERIKYASANGVSEEKTIIDPGLGFGKSTEGNLELIRDIHGFKTLGRPILIGPSRKSFVGHVLGVKTEERLPGTLAVCAAAISNGAHILRVHDVKKVRQAARMTDAIGGL